MITIVCALSFAPEDYRPNIFTLDLFDEDEDNGGGGSAAAESKTATVAVDGAAGRRDNLAKLVAGLGFQDDEDDGDA